MSFGVEDVLHEGVAFDTEGQGGTGGEADEAEGGSDGGESECEEVGDMESRCDGEVVL